MKLVITAQGQDMASEVDPRFGRAQYFILVDTETGAFSAHDNGQNLNAVQGAGIQAAQNVVNLGAEALLTGNVGPKAFAALTAGGVKMYAGAEGSVEQALRRFQAGEFTCVDGATVEGHWQ